MAITRRQHNQISLQAARFLRSRAVPKTQPAKWPPVQQPRRNRGKGACHSSLPAHPDHAEGTAQQDQPQEVESNRRPDPDSNGLLLGCEQAASYDNPTSPRAEGGQVSAYVDNGQGNPSLQNGLTSPQPLSALPESMQPEDIDDVGVPQDGKWDLVNAHECRFCIQHEEDEWLLENVRRWMYPSDFNISGAEVALEAKLQKYQSDPWDLNHRTSRAECNGDLWSHVDTPIQRGKIEDQTVYLIRWKLCWTRQSHIDDMGWVRSSFKAQNERTKRRRSARVEKTTPSRVAKRDAMMVVFKLDQYL